MSEQIRNPNIEIRNKFEYQNSKSAPMPTNDNSKPYDLEERTFQFAKASRVFVKQLPRTIANIEANESIGKKDFVMKIKTCRREAKESSYWLRLLDVNGKLDETRGQLVCEAVELMKIFGAI